MKHRKLGITGQIVLAMILAVVVGMAAGQHISPIKIVGDIFFRLIQMPIILLVMGQLIEAVGGLNPKEMGGMGRKTISIFLISSMSAAILGSVAGIWLKPGNDIKLAAISEQTSDTTVLEINSLSKTILGFFSKNIVESMSNGVIIQVILFAVLFGAAVSYVRVKKGREELYEVIVQFNTAILHLMGMIMKLAPLGIFAMVAATIGTLGGSVILPLLKYLLIYGGCTVLFLALWLILLSVMFKIPTWLLFQKISKISLVALATTSSAITLPTTLKDSKERLGIGDRVAKLVLPLGMSINCNGAAMHMAITAVTITQIYGISFGINGYLYIVIMATLLSMANAIVPGAGMVSLAMIVPQLGLPAESIAIFAGLEWFVGMYRTILNVDADVFTALLIAKGEKELDYEVLHSKEK